MTERENSFSIVELPGSGGSTLFIACVGEREFLTVSANRFDQTVRLLAHDVSIPVDSVQSVIEVIEKARLHLRAAPYESGFSF